MEPRVHAHQAKRLFGLVNGLQLTRIRPVWTPHWYYPFSDFTCGVRRGDRVASCKEASGNDIRGSKTRYFPDASPLRAPRVKWENRVNLAGRRNGTGIIILQDSDGNVNGGDGRLADGMGDGGDDGDADGRGEASGEDILGSKARYFPDASPLV